MNEDLYLLWVVDENNRTLFRNMMNSDDYNPIYDQLLQRELPANIYCSILLHLNSWLHSYRSVPSETDWYVDLNHNARLPVCALLLKWDFRNDRKCRYRFLLSYF